MAYTYQETYFHVLGEYHRPGSRARSSWGETVRAESKRPPGRVTRPHAGGRSTAQVLQRSAGGPRLRATATSGVSRRSGGPPSRRQAAGTWPTSKHSLRRGLGFRLAPDSFDHLVTGAGRLQDAGYVTAAKTPAGDLALLFSAGIPARHDHIRQLKARFAAPLVRSPPRGHTSKPPGRRNAQRGPVEFAPPEEEPRRADDDFALALENGLTRRIRAARN